jgi:hypothetical protein
MTTPAGDWPPIADAHLLARWRAADDTLFDLMPAFLQQLSERIGPEILTPPKEMAFTYPFGHPDRTTLVNGGEVRFPGEDEAATLQADRVPVLAIGANGSPTRLATKFLAMENRCALLTPAELDNADICALPFPAGYGSFPAGIARSPGTTVRCVVVDLTPEQLEWLAITEFSYHLGRLTGTTLRAADGREIPEPLAFIQRGGLYDVGEGAPAPLAAISATNRRWPAWEQRDLIAHIAGRIGLAGADPDALVSAINTDPQGWMLAHVPRFLAEATTAHDPPHVPHPAGAA